MNKWRLYVDTGGTFTDCIAHNPKGDTHRVKVLSNSALRGRLVQQRGKQWQVQTNWAHLHPIFAGYHFQVLGKDVRAQVLRFDPGLALLELDKVLPENMVGYDFELTAFEEAPILAARILTQTPLDRPLPPLEMRLGSTKGTNALLEHKGAKVGLLITRGLGDLLAIGTQQRPELFALNIQKPVPLYHRVWEVAERLDATGKIIHPLDELQIRSWIETGAFAECESIAVALLHSYRNPVHENRIVKILEEYNIPYISVSHLLAPEIKLLPRAQTSVANAYLAPVIEKYLEDVIESLPEGSLKVMTSAGGLIGADHFLPKDSLLSGPAGGIVGSVWAAQRAGKKRILTLDMGGTSTDVARYDGQYEYQYSIKVGMAELLSPGLAIETVAAGGGSICSFDGEKLQVGPESAGASPGPACYGAGGPLTLTDVNLLMGYLDPEGFPVPINIVAAQNALAEIKGSHRITDRQLLIGFLGIANEKMAGAIRNISVRKGYHPPSYTLLTFGGAGGQHACAVADLLGMKDILIPYDASILSARGMGQAVIERFVSAQVLKPYRWDDPALSQLLEDLQQKALQAVKAEQESHQLASINQLVLQMRLQGQDTCLDISYEANRDLSPHFRKRYEKQFGHWIDNRQIELASVRVSAILREEKEVPTYAEPTLYEPHPDEDNGELRVFCWENLKPGARFKGPSLLRSSYTSVVVPPTWTLKMDSHLSALIEKDTTQNEAGDSILIKKNDPAQLELFMHRFASIAEEMGALLERTSFSVNVKERLDFSCAVLDSDGYLVVNAPHIPVHLGSLGVCVRKVNEVLDLGPGDVAITNHPAFGGSHLPDITLIRAVFSDTGERLGFLANRAHHAEIGGKRPGSMPPDAKNLQEEGVVFSPMLLVEKGEARLQWVEDYLSSGPYPSRAIDENLADLNAGLAALQVGTERLSGLAKQYGGDIVRHYMKSLQSYTQQCLTKSLKAFSDKVYSAREYLDDGSPLSVRIEKSGAAMRFDFAGSASVHAGNLNANEAIVNSVVMYVLRLLLEENIPLNEGLMQQVKLDLPHSILSPHFVADPALCPAVVGGNVETSQRLVDTLLKALGLAACSQGTMNNLLFGDDSFGYYETICGGVGAGPGFAGADAVHQHMTNTRITDPEIMELRYPVRLERFAIRRGSGGTGKWHGGNGIIRELRFLTSLSLTLLSQHRVEEPYGMAGGKAGKKGEQWVEKANGKRLGLLGIAGLELEKGDLMHLETPGGGGYGN